MKSPDTAATPGTVRYSFDDMSFGLTNNGNKIDCKLVARPQGLANEAWYRFASDLIHILTIDPDAAATPREVFIRELRSAPSLDDNGYICTKDVAIRAFDKSCGGVAQTLPKTILDEPTHPPEQDK